VAIDQNRSVPDLEIDLEIEILKFVIIDNNKLCWLAHVQRYNMTFLICVNQ